MTDTMTRPTDEGSCSCGCGDPGKAVSGSDTEAGGCNCGCGTAAATAATPRTIAEEVAHLTELRQSIDRRLSELKS